jgi:hypothetical protein
MLVWTSARGRAFDAIAQFITKGLTHSGTLSKTLNCQSVKNARLPVSPSGSRFKRPGMRAMLSRKTVSVSGYGTLPTRWQPRKPGDAVIGTMCAWLKDYLVQKLAGFSKKLRATVPVLMRAA